MACASRTEPEDVAVSEEMRSALAVDIGLNVAVGVARPTGLGSVSDDSNALRPENSGPVESNTRLLRGGIGGCVDPIAACIGAKAKLAYGPGRFTGMGLGIGRA